jgi:hypothetical protein
MGEGLAEGVLAGALLSACWQERSEVIY